MPRRKSGDPPTKPARGSRVVVPPWWLQDARAAAAGMRQEDLAKDLSAAIKKEPPFDQSAVSSFLAGTVVTDRMVVAFREVFPHLLPVYFTINTREEAIALQSAMERLRKSKETKRGGTTEQPLTETIDDTGEQPLATATKLPARKSR